MAAQVACGGHSAIGKQTYLPAWRLREPQRPSVHERMLDVEVVRVVKDGDRLHAVVLAIAAGDTAFR